jgi:hypothetical protein
MEDNIVNNKKINPLTTVNIGKHEQKTLKKLAEIYSISNVQMLNLMVHYFKRTGINPADETFSPREEISKLEKRTEQVIKFLQHFERDEMKPLLDKLIITERRLNGILNELPSIEKIEQVISKYYNSIKTLHEQEKNELVKIKNAMLQMDSNAKLIFNKGEKRSKMIIILFQALQNRSLTGKFNDEDIKNFKDACS